MKNFPTVIESRLRREGRRPSARRAQRARPFFGEASPRPAAGRRRSLRKRPYLHLSAFLFTLLLSHFTLPSALVAAPDAAEMRALADRVRADTSPHTFLENLCDDFGGRLTGTPQARAAINRVADELRALGLKPELETFQMPGWVRGDDRVEMLAPLARPLRVAAISYTQPHDRFEATVVALGKGSEKDFAALKPCCSGCTCPPAAPGAIGLVEVTGESTREIVKRAVAHGLRGVLLTDRVSGGQLLARTGNHQGAPLPIPVYSITQEEGRWLTRLLARGETVRIAMHTRSRCLDVTATNVVLRLPGASPETIVVGAHIDSWDLGQGAIDNGIGTAQLYALAKALRSVPLQRTVELVWFDGEELGMWGSRHRAETTRNAPIVAMINLDMVGVPIAVNALGESALVPVLEAWNTALGDHRLTDAGTGENAAPGVHNVNWLGSDHTSFQFSGARAITFHGPIAPESVRYYHDLADTIDKVPPALITDSSAIIASLVYWLANDTSNTLTTTRRTDAEIAQFFAPLANSTRMKSMGWQPAALGVDTADPASDNTSVPSDSTPATAPASAASASPTAVPAPTSNSKH